MQTPSDFVKSRRWAVFVSRFNIILMRTWNSSSSISSFSNTQNASGDIYQVIRKGHFAFYLRVQCCKNKWSKFGIVRHIGNERWRRTTMVLSVYVARTTLVAFHDVTVADRNAIYTFVW